MNRIGTTALGLVLVCTGVADAGRSHGHHGGSHRSHSSGHIRGHRSKCAETSEVLGYRRCSAFGDWAKVTLLRPTTISLLTSTRVLRVPPVSLAGTTDLEDHNLSYRADRPTALTMNTLGMGLRLTIDVGAGLYVGGEGEIGAAVSPLPVRVEARNAERLTAEQGGYGQLVAVLGVRRTFGETHVAAEIVGGVLATPVVARFADDRESGAEHATYLSVAARLTSEARVRVSRWLSPWTSVGVFAGADITGRGLTAGLQLGVHLRAFDGGR